MKVRMKVRPTGYVSFGGGPLSEWPKVGAVVDFPDAVAEELVAAGNAEKVRLAKAEPMPAPSAPAPAVETRPAPTADEEHRAPAVKRPAAKKDAPVGG